MANIRAFFIIVALLSASSVFGQSRDNYISETDRLLTIKRVSILPVTDNVGGLYSRYIETKIKQQIKDNHRFEFSELSGVEARKAEELFASPSTIKSLGQKAGVDTLLSAQMLKSKKGRQLILDASDAPPNSQRMKSVLKRIGSLKEAN